MDISRSLIWFYRRSIRWRVWRATFYVFMNRDNCTNNGTYEWCEWEEHSRRLPFMLHIVNVVFMMAIFKVQIFNVSNDTVHRKWQLNYIYTYSKTKPHRWAAECIFNDSNKSEFNEFQDMRIKTTWRRWRLVSNNGKWQQQGPAVIIRRTTCQFSMTHCWPAMASRYFSFFNYYSNIKSARCERGY